MEVHMPSGRAQPSGTSRAARRPEVNTDALSPLGLSMDAARGAAPSPDVPRGVPDSSAALNTVECPDSLRVGQDSGGGAGQGAPTGHCSTFQRSSGFDAFLHQRGFDKFRAAGAAARAAAQSPSRPVLPYIKMHEFSPFKLKPGSPDAILWAEALESERAEQGWYSSYDDAHPIPLALDKILRNEGSAAGEPYEYGGRNKPLIHEIVLFVLRIARQIVAFGAMGICKQRRGKDTNVGLVLAQYVHPNYRFGARNNDMISEQLMYRMRKFRSCPVIPFSTESTTPSAMSGDVPGEACLQNVLAPRNEVYRLKLKHFAGFVVGPPRTSRNDIPVSMTHTPEQTVPPFDETRANFNKELQELLKKTKKSSAGANELEGGSEGGSAAEAGDFDHQGGAAGVDSPDNASAGSTSGHLDAGDLCDSLRNPSSSSVAATPHAAVVDEAKDADALMDDGSEDGFSAYGDDAYDAEVLPGTSQGLGTSRPDGEGGTPQGLGMPGPDAEGGTATGGFAGGDALDLLSDPAEGESVARNILANIDEVAAKLLPRNEDTILELVASTDAPDIVRLCAVVLGSCADLFALGSDSFAIALRHKMVKCGAIQVLIDALRSSDDPNIALPALRVLSGYEFIYHNYGAISSYLDSFSDDHKERVYDLLFTNPFRGVANVPTDMESCINAAGKAQVWRSRENCFSAVKARKEGSMVMWWIYFISTRAMYMVPYVWLQDKLRERQVPQDYLDACKEKLGKFKPVPETDRWTAVDQAAAFYSDPAVEEDVLPLNNPRETPAPEVDEAPVPPVLEPPAPSGSVAEAPRVSSGGTPSGRELQCEVGTVLRVHWDKEGASYEGSVVKCESGLSLVHYPVDGKKQWHDFDKDRCRFEVLEPAAHTIATLRRTQAGYDAQVVPGGRWYAMTREYVDDQFESEKAWLEKLEVGGPFESLPVGAKRRRGKAEPVKPHCALGSLAKSFASTGDSKGAELVSDDVEASLTAKCRLKFAASRASAYGYQVVKVHGHALEIEAIHPTLLQVSRTHAVTALHVRGQQGVLFDSAQPEPLPLTAENLEACIGHPYSGDIVRGYRFEPLPKAVKRKPSKSGTDLPASKRGRDL